jgi:hypothetical protein
MSSYTKTWTWIGIPVLAAASLSAALDSLGGTVLMFAVGSMAGAVVVHEHRQLADPTASVRASHRNLARPALVGGLLVSGSLGLAMIDGQLFLGVLLLAAITSPPVVGLAAGPGRPAYGAPLAEVIDIDAAPSVTGPVLAGYAHRVLALDLESALADVSSMTDQELCRSWRRSYVLLDAASSPASRLTIVQLRAAYLEELERRQPRALQAWLDAGGRAASGPDKFFSDAS